MKVVKNWLLFSISYNVGTYIKFFILIDTYLRLENIIPVSSGIKKILAKSTFPFISNGS